MGRKKQIEISPREPLTKKARAAIRTYVALRLKTASIGRAVDLAVQAERMSRAKLYSTLEARGYRWRTNLGRWTELKRDVPKKAPRATPKPAKSRKPTQWPALPTTRAAKPTKQITDMSPAELMAFIQTNPDQVRAKR